MTKTEIKQNIHNQIDLLEDSDKLDELQEIINFFINDDVVEWELLTEAERKGIEEGLKDAEEGRTVSYDEFLKKNKKWFQQ
jgi:predicted transcriptional regulator